MDYCISLSDSNKNLDPGQITQFIDGGLDGLNSTNEVSITVSASVHLITELQKSSDGMVAAYGDIEVGSKVGRSSVFFIFINCLTISQKLKLLLY